MAYCWAARPALWVCVEGRSKACFGAQLYLWAASLPSEPPAAARATQRTRTGDLPIATWSQVTPKQGVSSPAVIRGLFPAQCVWFSRFGCFIGFSHPGTTLAGLVPPLSVACGAARVGRLLSAPSEHIGNNWLLKGK